MSFILLLYRGRGGLNASKPLGFHLIRKGGYIGCKNESIHGIKSGFSPVV